VDGTFDFRAPPGEGSRVLTFLYYPHPGDTTPVARGALGLRVSAPVGLRVTPPVSAQGKVIDFIGKLLGKPIPRAGKQLILQARQALPQKGSFRGVGPWITFRSLRTDASGAFRAAYRFRLPGPVDYEFRAVSRAEGDYPYQVGYSPVAVVYER
jgi:hypothetical protein